MYPQSRSSGYERGVTQAWPTAQPSPSWRQPSDQPERAFHTTAPWHQPEIRPDVTWPPPSLHLVDDHVAVPSYRSTTKPGRQKASWKTKLVVTTMAFGVGVFARPYLEAQVRGLPSDTLVVAGKLGVTLPVWMAFSSLTKVAFVSAGETFPAQNAASTELSPRVAHVDAPTVTRLAPEPTNRTAHAVVAPELVPMAHDHAPAAQAPPTVGATATNVVARSVEHSPRHTVTPRHPEAHHVRLAVRTASPPHRITSESVAASEAPDEEVRPEPVPAVHRPPAPAPDSLDGLMNRAFASAPEPEKPAAARMRFPDQKRAGASAPKHETTLALAKPERITNDVAAAATAAAKAEAASAKSTPAGAAVALPKLPGKVRLTDDPLAGLNGKEIEGKRQATARSTAHRK